MPIANGFKERLMTALHTAVSSFNETADPNGAVVKAAQENDFNAEQTLRLVEMFNTARTIYHYKSANDRTEPFSLADSSVVIPRLFNDNEDKAVKAAASTASSDSYDYSCYDIPEADYRDGLEIKSSSGVRALDIQEPTDYRDTNLDVQGWRAMRVIRVQRDLAETARSEAGIAGTKAASIFTGLANKISRGYAEECQDRYDRLMGGYFTAASDKIKDQWGPVMSKFSEFVPSWMREAHEGVKFGAVIDDKDLGEYIDDLKEAKEWMENEASMLAMADMLDKQANDFEREYMEVLSPILSQKEAESIVSFINPKLCKAAKSNPDSPGNARLFSTTSEPLAIGKAVRESVGEGAKRKITDIVHENIGRVISGPIERENIALSERLKNVQRQIMLEDLMTNDPVLSEESPEVVVQTYNAILNLAPELTAHKELMRAVLRQAVHSVAISPYDAQALTDLERSISSVSGRLGRSSVSNAYMRQGGRSGVR